MLPLSYSLRNLARRRLRTALTVLGLALVTALITMLMAFSRGLTASLEKAASPNDIMLLSVGAEEDPIRSAIDRGQADDIAVSLPGVKEDASGRYIALEAHLATSVTVDEAGNTASASIRGVDAGSYRTHREVFVTEGHQPRGDFQLMAGELAPARLGVPSKRLAVGQTLWFEGVEWTIVGRFVAPGTPLENELWVDLEDLMTATRRTDITLVAATLSGPEAIPEIEFFTQERVDLQVIMQTETDWYASLIETVTPVAAMAAALALLMLFGGVAGCTNTMYANSLGRIREIGMLQAIGFTRRTIAVSLLIEGMALAMLAGVLGITLATAIGDVPLRIPMGAMTVQAEWQEALIGLGAAAVTGLLGTLFPLLRITRMSLVATLNAT